MNLTTDDKKILTLSLFTLSKMIAHPAAAPEIERVAEKVGVGKEFRIVQKMYGNFSKALDKMKDEVKRGAGEIEKSLMTPEDREMEELLKNAFKSQDNPDQN